MSNIFLAPTMTMTATSTALMANGFSTGVDLLAPKLDSFHYEGPIDSRFCSASNETNGQGGGGLVEFFRRAWPSRKSKSSEPKARPMSQEDLDKLKELPLTALIRGVGTGRTNFRVLKKKSVVDAYYRQGQGFALIPTVREAKVHIWRDGAEPIVARKGKIRWLREGDRVQIKLEGRRAERAFVFSDPSSESLYRGGHRYPVKMPDDFRMALKDVKAKPGEPSRIVNAAGEMVGFLSYSPALGYCLQPWKDHSVSTITHHGTQTRILDGPNSTRLERELIRDFLILDSFDVLQFDEDEPFELPYAAQGEICFNLEQRIVLRARMIDYTPFLSAINRSDHVARVDPHSVPFRITYNPDLNGYFIQMLRDWDTSVRLLANFGDSRTTDIQKERQRIRLPLDGYPIIQFGYYPPLIFDMRFLQKMTQKWQERADPQLDKRDIRMAPYYDLVGATYLSKRERIKKAYQRAVAKHDPEQFRNDPTAYALALAHITELNKAMKNIYDVKGWAWVD